MGFSCDVCVQICSLQMPWHHLRFTFAPRCLSFMSILTIAKPLFLYFDLFHLLISFKNPWTYHIGKQKYLSIPLGIFKSVLFPSNYTGNNTLFNIPREWKSIYFSSVIHLLVTSARWLSHWLCPAQGLSSPTPLLGAWQQGSLQDQLL